MVEFYGIDGKLQKAIVASGLLGTNKLFGGRIFPTNAKPVLTRNADGRLEVFIVGSDEQIYHNWQILFGGKLQWNSPDGIQLQALEV